MNKKYIDFYKKFILQTKTLNDGGVSLTVFHFNPAFCGGFKNHQKLTPVKTTPKNFTYFFVLAEVIRC